MTSFLIFAVLVSSDSSLPVCRQRPPGMEDSAGEVPLDRRVPCGSSQLPKMHNSTIGRSRLVMPHMGAPGANGWDLNPYVLRARIRSGQSGQDVVDLAGTGSRLGAVLNCVGCVLPHQVLRATRP